MKILGVDPGTRAAGFGVIEVVNSQIRAIEYGVINAKQTLPLVERLSIIHKGISSIIADHNPDIVSVERAFVGKNANTALTLGHARGVLMLAGFNGGAIIKEFAPTEIKKAVVGSGKATKEQVEYMVRALLQLPDTKIKNDAFDALAAAICAYNHK
jgi:crossover junction endodeoxyribonuclease RuvC